MKRTRQVALCGVLLLGLLLHAAYGALAIDSAALSPAGTPVGVATQVTVTARIAEPSVLPDGVNLQRLDTAGRVVAVLGLLHDDGLEGDADAGDKTFTIRTTIFETSPGQVRLRVSAGFRGALTRAFSSILPVNVTGAAATGITVLSPANLSYLSTSPVNVAGTVGDPGATVTINGINAPVSGGTFIATVPLLEGNNTLTAVAQNTGGTTSTSTIQVTLDTTPPRVTVESPANGLITTESDLTVSGTVNDIVVGTVNDQQAQVTVNGVPAQVANRSFLAGGIPLALGLNTIQVIGRDRTGNQSTANVQVTRQAPTQPFIRLISGNNQAGPVSSQLPAPLVIGLEDGQGHPVTNADVVFRVTDNNGLVNAGGAGAAALALTTDGAGQAQVFLKLGSRSGAGSNRVEATAPGFSGVASFTATGIPTGAVLITLDSGNNQTGALGEKLAFPFVVVVTDAGFNRIGGAPVTFAVKQGGGNFNGQPNVTMNTDPDGRAVAVLTLGTQPGLDNNIVEASFPGNTGYPATFVASAKAPGNAADTRISGVVLDNSNNPIAGVTMRLFTHNQGNSNNTPQPVGTPVQSDAQGAFLMQPVPVGYFKLMADGTTVNPQRGTFPTLEYDIVNVAGQNNTLGMPIYLPVLDTVNKLCVSETTGGTLTLPQVPGFSLTVAAGSATFPGGSRTGCVTVSTVNPDKSPMSPGFGQQPRFLITVQPVGTIFNPPAPISMPNVDGLIPGQVTELYSYDHDLSAFTAIGTGTVTADGLLIKSDPGIGIIKAGWHCGGNPSSSASVASLSVSINPTKVVIGVNDTSNLTAKGTPPLDGTYSWEIRATQAGDNANAATLVSSPSCNNQSSCTATIKGATAGTVATLRAHFKCTTTGAEVTADVRIYVVEVKFDKTGNCTGFDATASPPAIMVPKGGSNTGNVTVSPAAGVPDIKLESAATGTATVSPTSPAGSPQLITVTGVTAGTTEIRAKAATGVSILAKLEVDVKNRINKKIAIHAITEENDDVQTVAIGNGEPRQSAVNTGANGISETAATGDDVQLIPVGKGKPNTDCVALITRGSVAAGDDVRGVLFIDSGPDGICNTTATGLDLQILPLGSGEPNVPSVDTGSDGIANATAAVGDVQLVAVGKGTSNGACVGAGPNAFRDSVKTGDDVVAGDDINSGLDGICNSTANRTNLVPVNVPSAASLQTYLNDTVWGKQANIYFTVTRSDFTVNYDLNRNGGLADVPLDEVNAISPVAKDTSVDYNIYYVKNLEVPQATTVIALGLTWIQDSHANSTENVTAHEVGHLLGIAYESNDPIDVMLKFGSATDPCNVKKKDWDVVNP